MKKLLSLLSVLTISGTAIPTTIAASSYQIENNNNNNFKKTMESDSNDKKNNKITLAHKKKNTIWKTFSIIGKTITKTADNIKNNLFEKYKNNNLTNLNKEKIQLNQQKSRKILQLTEKLIIDSNKPQEYITSSQIILQNLIESEIIIPVINVGIGDDENIIYTLNNNNNYGYFRLPVEIRWIDEENQQSYQRNLELVLRTDNLYLQGFINNNNNYYHFNFNNVNIQRQPQNVRDGSVPLLTQIRGIQNYQLRNIGPDYRDLLPRSNNNINWNNIYNSFLYLTNNININEENAQQNSNQYSLARSLGHVIFVTAEALRFRNIYNIIRNNIINNNQNINLSFQDDQIYQILTNWGMESRRYRSILFNEQNRYQGFDVDNLYGIDLFIHNIIGNSEFNFIDDLTPIDVITEYLRSFNTRVLLGAALPHIFYRITSNCNKKTKFENPFWKKQFCNFEPQIKKINGEIKIVKTLNKDNKDKNLKSGYIFVGTTEGLYLILENGIVLKTYNIDNIEITNIKEFGNGNFYVSTSDEKVYFLNTKFVNNGNIIGEIQPNIESSNLEKELKLYFRSDHKNEDINFAYNEKNYNYFLIDLFVGKINPLNYEKIEFLGDNFHWTRISWGKNAYYSDKKINDYNNMDFDDLAINRKIENNNEINKYADKYIQWIRKYSAGAVLRGQQHFGITWYWENKNYYVQFLVKQYGEHWTGTGGAVFMGIGNSIRLYNEENNNNNLKLYSQKSYFKNILNFKNNLSKFKKRIKLGINLLNKYFY